MKELLLFIIMTLPLLGCTGKKNNDFQNSKEEELLYKPSYSSNFSINKIDDSSNVAIISKNPWQGAKDVTTRFYIIKDGLKHPHISDKIINSAERIVCMSSTHVAMLDALEATDKIVAVSGKQYISNPKVRDNPAVSEIGYEGNIDYEVLMASQPDLILLFAVNGASTMEPKLKELGIPYLYVGDYLEEDPLGKAEWIVALAEIIGEREKGMDIFRNISANYERLRHQIKEEVDLSRPKIMVNAPFMDSWFIPSKDSYVARMIEDAGGDYIYKKNSGNSSVPIDMEEALKLVSEADFWINIGTVKTAEELKANFPKFKDTRCVINGKIFNNNYLSSPGGGNDSYESGVVNPDVMLRDVVKIFHPHLVEEDFVYYHQLK